MKAYDEIKTILDNVRSTINESAIRESSENNIDYKNDAESIPYTMQDELMSSSIEACKKQFGADFENFKTPMLYYPQDGDIVLSGEIGTLNNAKFQFRLKDPTGEGCFIWTEPIQLTENNLNQLKIVYGVFKNWKNDLETAEDKKPMGMNGMDSNENNETRQMIEPGDDY